MMKVSLKVQNNKKQEEVASGFLGGLNTFQDETLIKDSELSEAKNILLSIDGIQPRPGTLTYGTGDSAARIDGAFGYYKSNGTREFLRMAGGKLQKYLADGTLSDIDTSYTTLKRTELIQALDKAFIVNDTDGLSYYDGSSVTHYVALTSPGSVTVTPQGSSGSTAYSYKITAFNSAGETLSSTAATTSSGNATLSSTNFNRIGWGAVTGATGYNIYGRLSTGIGETYLDTVYTNSYDDKGARTPSTTLFPPETNTTGGIKANMVVFGLSRIFAAGDPANPSRLYYSDIGTKVGNFNIGIDSNAGYVDVFKNDGYVIRAILPFQGGIVVWKDNAIYKFTFVTVSGDFNGDGVEDTVSLPQLEEITRSFGGISFRSTKHVENDIIFAAKKDGRLAFYSLGNQENYAGSVLRTNELSIKVQEKLEDVSVDYLPYAAGFYYNNIYACSVAKSGSSKNDRTWCLDTRFGAWTYWEGFYPSIFVIYNDSSGGQTLYFGEDDGGDMVQAFYPTRSDNGAAIDVLFSTKAFNQKQFHRYKKYQDPVFQFKDVSQSGALTGEIYVDGAVLQGGFTINQQIIGGAGIGYDLPGQALPGDAGGGINSTQGVSSDIIVEVKKVTRGRSIKYNFRSSVVGLQYKFLSLAHKYTVLPSKQLPQTTRFYATS